MRRVLVFRRRIVVDGRRVDDRRGVLSRRVPGRAGRRNVVGMTVCEANVRGYSRIHV